MNLFFVILLSHHCHPALAVTLAATGLLWAGTVLASGNLQDIQSVNATWDADLAVALEGGKKQLELGDEVRFHLSAAEGGYCYLLHVDTNGNASVMQPSNCSNADSVQDLLHLFVFLLINCI